MNVYRIDYYDKNSNVITVTYRRGIDKEDALKKFIRSSKGGKLITDITFLCAVNEH